MQLYENEHRQSRLILYLTYLAIFISFLGLTGLASFTTNLRTREIGIRKVLGADVFVREALGLLGREQVGGLHDEPAHVLVSPNARHDLGSRHPGAGELIYLLPQRPQMIFF